MDNNLSTLGYFIQEMNTPTFVIYLEFQGKYDSFVLRVNERHTFTGTRYDAACEWLEALYEAQK